MQNPDIVDTTIIYWLAQQKTHLMYCAVILYMGL